LRPLSECSADDGQVVGHMLMDLMEGKPKDVRLAILKFANRTAMLRECSYPHIGEMLVALLMFTPQSDSKPSPAVVAQTTALATEEEASRIGSALASIIHSSRTAAEAVQTALRLHAVLRTTTSAHIWFVPMVEAMAERMSAGAARPLAAAHFVHRRSWVHRPSASVQPGEALEPPLGSADNVDIGDGESSFNSVVCRFEPSCHVHRHAWFLLRSGLAVCRASDEWACSLSAHCAGTCTARGTSLARGREPCPGVLRAARGEARKPGVC
jgi:hypothetical protein